uniref:Uncharacterized protein n=1 Tax=Arundo donax TaxID=35708 RepID=A0A0A9BA40_ARUDO
MEGECHHLHSPAQDPLFREEDKRCNGHCALSYAGAWLHTQCRLLQHSSKGALR